MQTEKDEDPSAAVAMLKSVYFRRLDRNPSYSLRAFSKNLAVSHTLLSLIFSGKRKLSSGVAEKIIDRLDLTFKQRELFFKEFQPDSFVEETGSAEQHNNIEMEIFAMMSEWQH